MLVLVHLLFRPHTKHFHRSLQHFTVLILLSTFFRKRPSKMRTQSCILGPVYGFLDEAPHEMSECAERTPPNTSFSGSRKLQYSARIQPRPGRNSGPHVSASVVSLPVVRPDEQLCPPPHHSQPQTECQSQQQQLEECKKLIRACQEELERSVHPCSKWYEMKSPEFHLEANRHNTLVQKSAKWKKILQDSHTLLQGIDAHEKTVSNSLHPNIHSSTVKLK